MGTIVYIALGSSVLPLGPNSPEFSKYVVCKVLYKTDFLTQLFLGCLIWFTVSSNTVTLIGSGKKKNVIWLGVFIPVLEEQENPLIWYLSFIFLRQTTICI